MNLPTYRVTYPDTQSAKLSELRARLLASGKLDDGKLHGWSLVQRLGNSPKGSALGKPYLEIQIFETPTGVLPNRARESEVNVALFWFGKPVASNFNLARDVTDWLEGEIIAAHPTLRGWTSLQPAEVEGNEGLFVAYLGSGQIVQPPKIETI